MTSCYSTLLNLAPKLRHWSSRQHSYFSQFFSFAVTILAHRISTCLIGNDIDAAALGMRPFNDFKIKLLFHPSGLGSGYAMLAIRNPDHIYIDFKKDPKIK